MKKNIGDFTIGNTIGQGTFGKVKKGTHLLSGQSVAIKILEKSKINNKKDIILVEREIKILKAVEHPNIIRLLQIYETEKQYYLVTELAEGQQLFQVINSASFLNEKVASAYFCQLLSAVSFLHAKGICHRDIKPENIIVNQNSLKLIDFGLGSFYSAGDRLKTSCGSPCYAAPEMLVEGRYDPEKSDVWALGITLYAMLSGQLPFQHKNVGKLYEMISKGAYDPIPNISENLSLFLSRLIQTDPQQRLSLSQIKQQEWIKKQPAIVWGNAPFQFSKALIDRMKNIFGRNEKEIEERVKAGLNACSTYYYLMFASVEGSQDEGQEWGFHSGPVHIQYVFSNLPPIKDFLQQHHGKSLQWSSQYKGAYSDGKFQIKKIGGSHLFYLSLAPSIFQDLCSIHFQ